MDEGLDAVVLIPVKAFAAAKARLAPALDGAARAQLARAMAERVVAAAAPLSVAIACDDPEVASWAEELGAAVIDTTGLDLNGSVRRGVDHLFHTGAASVVVAHGDLPMAGSFERLLGFNGITLVPDRHDDGTNVLVLPAAASDFTFAYGAASFAQHRHEADRLRVEYRVVRLADLQWDVDTPEDLTEATGRPAHPLVT